MQNTKINSTQNRQATKGNSLNRHLIELNSILFTLIRQFGEHSPEIAHSITGASPDVVSLFIRSQKNLDEQTAHGPTAWCAMRPEVETHLLRDVEDVPAASVLPERRSYSAHQAQFHKTLSDANFRGLFAARSMATCKPMLAKTFLGVSDATLNALIDAPLEKLIVVANSPVFWFRLKYGDDFSWWKMYFSLLTSCHWGDARVKTQTSLLAMQMCLNRGEARACSAIVG